jgi:hypothetical protein
VLERATLFAYVATFQRSHVSNKPISQGLSLLCRNATTFALSFKFQRDVGVLLVRSFLLNSTQTSTILAEAESVSATIPCLMSKIDSMTGFTKS